MYKALIVDFDQTPNIKFFIERGALKIPNWCYFKKFWLTPKEELEWQRIYKKCTCAKST